MDEAKNNFELMDDYLAGKMSEGERMDFESLVTGDQNLKSEVEFQQSIIDALPEVPADLDAAVTAFVTRLKEKNENVNYLLDTQAPINARNIDRAYRKLRHRPAGRCHSRSCSRDASIAQGTDC